MKGVLIILAFIASAVIVTEWKVIVFENETTKWQKHIDSVLTRWDTAGQIPYIPRGVLIDPDSVQWEGGNPYITDSIRHILDSGPYYDTMKYLIDSTISPPNYHK